MAPPSGTTTHPPGSATYKAPGYFSDPDQRLSWDSVLSEAAESVEGSDPKRIGVIHTGIALVQAILLETIIMYHVMPPQATLLAWPGNVN